MQLTEAWRGDSQQRFAEACRSGWEGLIAKRAERTVCAGPLEGLAEAEVRLGAGVRRRRLHRSARSRTDCALLVGYYEDGRLQYAGKVGTGYTAATLRDLAARLRELETPESPFVDARPVPRGTHWTRPELVAQIAYAEWTRDARLHQPRFLGLRDDKTQPRSSGSGPDEHEASTPSRSQKRAPCSGRRRGSGPSHVSSSRRSTGSTAGLRNAELTDFSSCATAQRR